MEDTESDDLEWERMWSDTPQYFDAAVVAVPQNWNSFCYIVSVEDCPYKTLYFSEAAVSKPANKEIGSKGFVYFKKIGCNTSIHLWIDTVQ